VAGPQDFWDSEQPRRIVQAFNECRDALNDQRLTSDPYAAGVTDRPSHNLLMMSGQPHRVLRGLVIPFLTPAGVAGLSPGLTAARDHYLRRLFAAGTGDLITNFVEPLVCQAALESVGIIQQARPVIAPLLRSMVGMLEPEDDHAVRGEAMSASIGIAAVLNRHGRDGNAEGLHRSLLEAHAQGEISKEDLNFTLPVVLHGGYENPLNYLGSLVAIAAEDPAQFRASARAWPEGLMEESLRLRPPARGVARWATAACPSIGAAAGDPVWVDLESANQDATVFGSPAQPDYAAPPRHPSFGHGSHRCPGVHLARLLGRLVIDGLLMLPEAVLREAVVAWRVGVVGRGVTAVRLST
jgi:cytochrome P450